MNIFTLTGTILVDSRDAENSIAKTGKLTDNLGDKMSVGLKKAAKWGAGVVAAAGAAAVGMSKAAAELYADYEQLTGGIETLFGESQDKVMQYAENAYKTAGLSANEYMETVTSFSASLLQSLDGDTAAAATKADQAITDMADNANKMGTSMEMIQNAYQGFAKANYTMLDNLKLGYGGTKTEMERLLEDATALSGIEYDISSYADIVDAIHVVQTEMGITGTTALEASETISGSIAATKSAWQNLLTGLADSNADIGKLVDNFVSAAGTAFGNIFPVVEQILQSLMVAIQDFFPQIAEKLPEMVGSLLPTLIETAIELVKGVVDMLPEFIQMLVDMLPEIIDALVNGLIELAPELVKASVEIIGSLAAGLTQALPTLLGKAPELIGSLVEAIVGALPSIYDAGQKIINSMFSGIKSMWTSVRDYVSDKVSWIADKLMFWRDSKDKMDGSHAAGLAYVPYDGYKAELHKGETVLNAQNTANLIDSLKNSLTSAAQPTGPIELVLNIDGAQFATATYDAQQKEGQRRGGRLVLA